MNPSRLQVTVRCILVTNISPIDRNEEEAYFSEPEHKAVTASFQARSCRCLVEMCIQGDLRWATAHGGQEALFARLRAQKPGPTGPQQSERRYIMADPKDPGHQKTLEMRVAELEDKLSQMHISEE